MPPSAAIKTLGCKLNQFESQQIRQQLQALGCCIAPFESVADIYVVNSCTVTARTDRDCRRLIRHARHLNPVAFIVVTGCYAEVAPEALAALPEADLVVGNAGKATLGAVIRQRTADRLDWPPGPTPDRGQSYAGGPILEDFADHTRAFVKVQEGCDAHCTYCIIPRARGKSRSVPVHDVLAQAESLIAAGHPELVLIGTHLGRYGQDLPDSPDLAGLLRALCDLPGLGRLRLSSIEPMEVTPEVVELVAHHVRLARHLHIPLQSGCDAVLQRMGRPYSAAAYADLVRRIHQADPAVCVGADVMVGFPGETEEEFLTTRRFLEDLPLGYLHVFTYSRRAGTPAADMPDQVPHPVAIARNHALRELSEEKRAAFANSMVGQTVGVVLERPVPESRGVLDGLSDNYLRVHVPGPETLLGTLQSCVVVSAREGLLQGRLAP